MGSIVGIWSMFDQRSTAKASERASYAAMFSSAAAEGRAEAAEAAERANAKNAAAKEAQNPDLEDAMKLSKKKRGVQSTYTASVGSGSGMMKDTSLTPIGGGDTGAVGAV